MAKQDSGSELYWGITNLIGVITFISCWVYSIAASGFIIGVLIGWIPSLLVAVIIGVIWPFLAIIALFIWSYIFLIPKY